MRYAWVSQRGYYPESPNKENQDAYVILPSFGNVKDQAFFGVFDGHGKDGHHCAKYAKDHLPRIVQDKLDKAMNQSSATLKNPKQALTVAHFVVNEDMHSDKRFDDSLSGTTAISILFRGKVMYIANVGDSRAIVVSRDSSGRLVARPLSVDQTPYRKDERARLKKYGARILSMDQIEGLEPVHENWGDLNLGEDLDEGGDPPRVWSKNGDYPGTAFSRSLGDSIAEDCGVVAEPEILEREIVADDKYLVIASDGVFEFLTNQMVADLLAAHDDPLDACKAVVAASYEMWLQYEVRTDDITIIALFVDEISTQIFEQSSSFYVTSPPTCTPTEAAHQVVEASVSSFRGPATVLPSYPWGSPASLPSTELTESRPVRRVMSKEKRKNMIQLSGDEPPPLVISASVSRSVSAGGVGGEGAAKSEEEAALIGQAIKSNFLFQHLTLAQRSTVIGVMRRVAVAEGEWVIRQGDDGDRFYIVDSGRFEVRVKPPGPANPNLDKDKDTPPQLLTPEELTAIAGSVVHVYESGPNQHPGFGELSLMYGKPRAASVRALTAGVLWSLDRRVFKKVVLRPTDTRREIIRTLKRVELFKSLSLGQLQRLTDLLNEAEYQAGQRIITQGETGDAFYLLVSGRCDCTVNLTPPPRAEGTDGQGEEEGCPNPNPAPPQPEAKVVMQLKEYDYFGERALLESKPRAANVVATSAVRVLFISKGAFEEVLGPLASIIDADRRKREALSAAQAKRAVPRSRADLALQGTVCCDSLGPLLLGRFSPSPEPQADDSNVSVRSFVLSEVERLLLRDSMLRFLEAARAVTTHADSCPNVLVPAASALLRESNAVHLVFACPIVADLSGMIRAMVEQSAVSTDGIAPDIIWFSMACLVSALETLHEALVVYRAVQPESLYVDAKGRLVLLDYRVCKVGLSSGERTFTVCGATDYLSPEQVSQVGHSYPVDLWGMGVLLYELAVGSHPFSAASEVATYTRISTFGSKAFSVLKFPEHTSAEVKSLINQLLMPTPEARIGAGAAPKGFAALKKHPFFSSNPFSSGGDVWEALAAGSLESPLLQLAAKERRHILEDGVEKDLLDSFDREEPAGLGTHAALQDYLDTW